MCSTVLTLSLQVKVINLNSSPKPMVGCWTVLGRQWASVRLISLVASRKFVLFIMQNWRSVISSHFSDYFQTTSIIELPHTCFYMQIVYIHSRRPRICIFIFFSLLLTVWYVHVQIFVPDTANVRQQRSHFLSLLVFWHCLDVSRT